MNNHPGNKPSADDYIRESSRVQNLLMQVHEQTLRVDIARQNMRVINTIIRDLTSVTFSFTVGSNNHNAPPRLPFDHAEATQLWYTYFRTDRGVYIAGLRNILAQYENEIRVRNDFCAELQAQIPPSARRR